MHLPTLIRVTILFGKYVCVLFFRWVRLITAKAEWDKAALALANTNSKAINSFFCGVSTDEFHRISHVKTAKEALTILETTYEGTKKVKDTKLQMLTTRF